VRVGDKVKSFWSRTPEKFILPDGEHVDSEAVKEWLDPL